MTGIVATILLVFSIPATLQLQDNTLGVSDHPTTLEERDAILTRLARHAGEIYTQHDVAVVLHEREPNDFHHISKRDLSSVTNNDEDGMIRNVRLDLASGSTMKLRLRKRSLFDSDTQFIDNVGYGRVKRAIKPRDCYAAGDVVKNGTRQGSVSVATCSGLHGKAFSNGIEYYIHPVDHAEGEQHHVHLFTRSVPVDDSETSLEEIAEITGDDDVSEDKRLVVDDGDDESEVGETIVTNKTTSFVFEMAVFVDSTFWNEIHKIHPDREDEYILRIMAEVNALYSALEDYGYYVKIKIKLYEAWIVDPKDYIYKPGKVLRNIQSFCRHTRTRGPYKYDLHYGFVGTLKRGTGYTLGKVCEKKACVGASSRSVILTAHEIGHSVGLSHGNAGCPYEDKRSTFMNGAQRVTPCIKWRLDNFFYGKGKGKCLFKETKETKTSKKFANLPQVFGGQYRNPDAYCKYRYGDDYELFRPYDFRGREECLTMMCINRNNESQEYLRIHKINSAPQGYTCGDDMFCNDKTCDSWDIQTVPINQDRLREIKRENHWSEWSQDWTPCTHTCGTGVQLKRRRCIFSEGPFLSPYCPGSPIQSRSCNENPCPGEQEPIGKLRQTLGDQVCERFQKNKGLESLLPKSTSLKLSFYKPFTKILPNKSCFFQCVRNPEKKNLVDSIYPDGTPCTAATKYKRKQKGLKFRCVEGACMEFSNQP